MTRIRVERIRVDFFLEKKGTAANFGIHIKVFTNGSFCRMSHL